MVKFYFNSLDLDWQEMTTCLSCSKELAEKIRDKITQCKHCIIISLKLSNYKGYHIEMYCDKKCDNCRLVYDDFRRFAEDTQRLPQFNNLIFDVKHGY